MYVLYIIFHESLNIIINFILEILLKLKLKEKKRKKKKEPLLFWNIKQCFYEFENFIEYFTAN